MEHLRRVWHASRERLSSRPLFFGLVYASIVETSFPELAVSFSRLFTLNTPRYFLDFAFDRRQQIVVECFDQHHLKGCRDD